MRDAKHLDGSRQRRECILLRKACWMVIGYESVTQNAFCRAKPARDLPNSHAVPISHDSRYHSLVGGYSSTLHGLLDWFEVDSRYDWLR